MVLEFRGLGLKCLGVQGLGPRHVSWVGLGYQCLGLSAF